MSLPELIFYGQSLSDALRAREGQLDNAAAAFKAEIVRTRSVEEVAAQLVKEHGVEPLALDWAGMTVSSEDAQIDVSGEWDRVIFDRSRPFHVSGTRLTFHIPFAGERDLFKFQPSTYTLNPPRAIVGDRELRLVAIAPADRRDGLKSALDAEVAKIKQYVEYTNADVLAFNAQLEARARAAATRRQEKVKADEELVASFGIPVRDENSAGSARSGSPPRRGSAGKTSPERSHMRHATGQDAPSGPRPADKPTEAVETYDVALSFAGEQREYVERVAALVRAGGARVFYDLYETVNLWGKNLYDHLQQVYRERARYVVIFASTDYAEKAWTNHERQSAQARALELKREYILPARFDDTEIPGILKTVAYIDLRRTSPEKLAELILDKIGSADA